MSRNRLAAILAYGVLIALTALALPATAGVYFWDSNTDPGYQGASGTWGSDAYWTTDGTTLGGWLGAGNDANFASSDGTWTVTVGGTQDVGKIIFGGAGYTLSGGTLNVALGGGIQADRDAAIQSGAIGLGAARPSTGPSPARRSSRSARPSAGHSA